MSDDLALGRVPPHNVEAERSVLGSMMLDREAVVLALETLQPHDFYSAAHQEIYRAMQHINTQGQPVDLVTLVDELYRRGTMEGVGGIAFLTELSRFVPTTSNAKAYIQIVEEKSTLRKLIVASGQISKDGYEASRDIADILNDAERSIYDISMKKSGDTFVHINPVLVETYNTIEQICLNKGQLTGVPTGFRDLDKLTTGLHPGELVLVAARPSMGKTSLAINIAQYAAVHAQKHVAVFSLEMPAAQLGNRMLCCEADVDMQQVRHGILHDDDWERLASAMGPLSMAPIFIDDTSGITINQMRSRCRRLKIEHGLDMIVIDYLQLMNGNSRTDNRQQEISEISRGLKGLAQELGVPLIALSQLSRAPQGRADHRPILSDLRDSGAIEQDADLVMFIYRDEYYNKESEERNIAEIIISKQRNGPLGTIKLAWLGQFTKFADLPPDYNSVTEM